jgi:hypothetical protein
MSVYYLTIEATWSNFQPPEANQPSSLTTQYTTHMSTIAVKMTLTPSNQRAIECAFEGARLVKQEPGFPPVTGYTYRRNKTILFVADGALGSLRNARPLAHGNVGTTFELVA